MLLPMIEVAAILPADPIVGLQPRLLGVDEAPLAVPLLLALTRSQATDTHQQITKWIHHDGSDGHRRGIMTLRTLDEVIIGMFFFALRLETARDTLLRVPCLRAAEPMGRHHTLAAALRAIGGFSDRLGCREALLEAEEAGAAWLENAAALLRIGRAHGFAPRGPDWVRSFGTGGPVA